MDWQTAEEKEKQKIYEYIDSISSLEDTIQQLEIIVKQSRQAGIKYTSGLDKLLKILGEKQLM